MGLPLSPQDWFDLFLHFAVLSLMGIGGPSQPRQKCTDFWSLKKIG
jgi:hypothetical protein